MVFQLASADLEQTVNSLGIRTVLISGLILIVCTFLAIALKKNKRAKLPLFLLMASTMIVSTSVLFGGTIYLNNRSESKGPVHWHADIEFWACGVELELRNPHGWLSNKIGTTTYHEHNDKRIHLEGVVVRKAEDASLRKFITVTGGYLTDSSIAVPLELSEKEWFVSSDSTDGDKQRLDQVGQVTPFVKFNAKNEAYAELSNGYLCDTRPAEVQVFVYRFNKEDKTYTQEKLAEPTSYIMRDESVVPPGDCVIVEFDASKPKTDKLCLQYGVRDSKRCTEFGVKEFNADLCNIVEVE